MNRKILSLAVAIMFVLFGTSILFAEGPSGDKRKGKYTYKKVYKTCAKRGAIESTTPFISPSDKTMAQWERIFDKKKFEIFKCSEEFNALSEADLQDIYAYLYNFAADSPSPAKCK
ncbi:cytochrome c family protein [Desulfobacula sp.]|uniref:cytochrome c family protein n=1 Tax=Desulfobacula sp. TaxID=2593537 RepID=UPI00261285F2|nr:cytochrome c family protein [Desulfobacula sp.]